MKRGRANNLPLSFMTIKNIIFTDTVSGSSSGTSSYVVGSTVEGTNNVLLTADMSTRQLLEGIYVELQKLNLRQEEAFEETVNNEDIL